MKYGVQVVRIRREYLIVEVNAKSPDAAALKAAKTVKADKRDRQLHFTDGGTTGYEYIVQRKGQPQ